MCIRDRLQTDNHASTSSLKFLRAGCPSCRPTDSVKALKASQSTERKSKHWRQNWKYITYLNAAREGPSQRHGERAQKNLVKIKRAVSEICLRTHVHTDWSQYCAPLAGWSNEMTQPWVILLQHTTVPGIEHPLSFQQLFHTFRTTFVTPWGDIATGDMRKNWVKRWRCCSVVQEICSRADTQTD